MKNCEVPGAERWVGDQNMNRSRKTSPTSAFDTKTKRGKKRERRTEGGPKRPTKGWDKASRIRKRARSSGSGLKGE